MPRTAKTEKQKTPVLPFIKRVDWAWLTHTIARFIVIWLLATLLMQQLERGVHHQLWSDPAQTIFYHLTGEVGQAQILVEAVPTKGPATLTELKERAENTVKALGYNPQLLEVRSEARATLGLVGLSGSIGSGQRITVLAQAITPQGWGAGPEPQNTLTIQWSSQQTPDDLLYLRRRLARPIRANSSFWRRILLGRPRVGQEQVVVKGPLMGTWDDVLLQIDDVAELVNGKRVTIQGGTITMQTPSVGLVVISLDSTPVGLELVVRSGIP